MANLNELKKELSKLSGVDFFNPKYRNVFKKYMTTETEEVEQDSNEEERLRTILGEEKETEVREDDSVEDKVETKVEEKEETEDKEELKTKEDIIEESNEEDEEESVETEKEDTEDEELEEEDTEEDFDEFEEETEDDDSIEESDNEEESMEEDPTDEVVDEEVETEEYHEEKPDYSKELIDTKVELGLVKAGVRDDRLEDARKLFMADFKGMEDLEHLGEFIKKYPEWIKKGVYDSKAFGMPTKDMGDGYTEEEKKLRSMGINPR